MTTILGDSKTILEYYKQFLLAENNTGWILREEHLCEGASVEIKSQGKLCTSKGHSGDHTIDVEYWHHHDDDGNPTGHHIVDFYTDKMAMGSGHRIPAHHKNNLMRHLGQSINRFVADHKPQALVFKTANADPDKERKQRQYRDAAEMLAKKYGGTPEHTDRASYVHFPHH